MSPRIGTTERFPTRTSLKEGLLKKCFKRWFYPNVAKVENAPGPQRQGWSRSNLLRTLDNKGDVVLSAFSESKYHGKKTTISGNNLGLRLDRSLCFASKPLLKLFYKKSHRVIYATIGFSRLRWAAIYFLLHEKCNCGNNLIFSFETVQKLIAAVVFVLNPHRYSF